MSPNRILAVMFVGLAVLQTGTPVAMQAVSRAIVYRDLLHAAILVCLAAAIGVTLYQVTRWRLGLWALMTFYFGVGLLVAFDLWIELAIDASC